MTDYELYQVLDSNNYEPNKENLKILKEGLDTGDFIIVCEDENGDLKFLADDEKEAIEGYDKIIAKTDDENVKDQLEHIKQEEKNHLDYLETAQKDKDAKYEDDHEIKESFTDYELYKLLEENKYAPTKRNLYILKEGLIEGDIEILNEINRYTKEAIKNLTDKEKEELANTKVDLTNNPGMKKIAAIQHLKGKMNKNGNKSDINTKILSTYNLTVKNDEINKKRRLNITGGDEEKVKARDYRNHLIQKKSSKIQGYGGYFNLPEPSVNQKTLDQVKKPLVTKSVFNKSEDKK